MSAMDRLDQIESRAKGQPWVSELYADNAALVAALRAVMALDMGHSANNPHAYCISPLALRRAVEEALS